MPLRGAAAAWGCEIASAPVDAGIDVAGAGDFKAREASEGAEGGDDLLGDDLGGFAKGARELQGDGRGELAEF